METTLIDWLHQLGTLEFWEALLEGFEGLGPLVPILLAMVESIRAVKIKNCEAVKKSDKLLKFTLDDGSGTRPTADFLASSTAGSVWPQAARWCFCSGGGWSSAFSGSWPLAPNS